MTLQLLLPAHTDIRDGFVATGKDYVEVPAGSGCFYDTLEVCDAGKGFANEHRIGWIFKTTIFGLWPTPIP